MIKATRQNSTLFAALMSSTIDANGHVCPESGLNIAVFTGNNDAKHKLRRVPIL